MNDQQKIKICARVAYEASRSCALAVDSEDFTRPWEEAGDWLQDNWQSGVARVLAGDCPEQRHRAFVEEMTQKGWKYGPETDAEKKEHPDLMPYADLPAERRLKNQVYVDVILAVGRALGLPVPFTLTFHIEQKFAAGTNPDQVLTAIHQDLEKLLKR
jgi:hypothetical protein